MRARPSTNRADGRAAAKILDRRDAPAPQSPPPPSGMLLAFPAPVRILEARFHPRHKDDDAFIVVGHVVWEGERRQPVVQPSASLGDQRTPGTILSKLQYLVAVTAPESFERLQTLRSRFWSFVPVGALSQGGS
jgi:hypothetical protein